MTTPILIPATDLERKAFNTGGDIEIDTDEGRAYLTVGSTRFVCELTAVTM